MAAKELTLEDLKTKVGNEWKVDKETCIGCRACADTYGEAFGFDDDASVAFETAVTEPGKFDPDEVIQICPSDSIFIPGYVNNPTAQGGQWVGNTGDAVEEVELEEGEEASPYEKVLRPSAEAPQEVEEVLPEPIFTTTRQKILVALSMPLTGALPPLLRKWIEDRTQDELYFSEQASAAFNMVANYVLYSLVALVAYMLSGGSLFDSAVNGSIAAGFMLATAEALFRFIGGPLWYRGNEKRFILGAFYTLPLTIANTVRNTVIRRPAHLRRSPFTKLWADGSEVVDDEREMVDLEMEADRRRRYGNVVEMENLEDRAVIRLEFPRRTPDHPEREAMGIGDVMPHYKYSLSHDGNVITLIARVPDGDVGRLISQVNSFPPAFRKNFFFEEPIASFEERYDEATRTLQITALKVLNAEPAIDPIDGHTDAMNRAA